MTKQKNPIQCYFAFQRFPAGILKWPSRPRPSDKSDPASPCPKLLIIITKYISDAEVIEHIM